MHAMIMTVMGLEPAWKEMEASEPCDYVSLYRQQLLILQVSRNMTSLWTHRQENPAALFVDLRAKRTDVDL